MIIYNHNQEFVGIDQKDLKSIGFANLAELQNTCKDFADLFVNRPTYIHNFKNFNWIYYILNSNLGEAKVIISAKNREFSASLEIETFYLTDAPTQVAYAINITKLKALDGKEIEQSKVEPPKAPVSKLTPNPKEEYLPNLENEKAIVLSEPDLFETPKENIIKDPYDFDFNAPLEIEDVYTPTQELGENFDLTAQYDFDSVIEESPAIVLEEPKAQTPQPLKTKPMLGDYTVPSDSEYINNLHVSKDYIFNPKVASDELGLPVDLIEEFIGDFIQQSYEFKDELYNHFANNELSEVKLLSHKLKGVAANLRIEDAFEVLSIINSSSNLDEIKATLDHFYKIIAKLEGKEVPQESIQETKAPQAPIAVLKEDDDIYDFTLKFDEDEPQIEAKPTASIKEKKEFDTIPEMLEERQEILIDPLEYSKSAAVNELGLPEDLIEELLGDFKEQAQSLMEHLQKAVEMDDKVALSDIAMNIKGTADNLRIMKVSAILENLLQENSMQESKALLAHLQNYINQL